MATRYQTELALKALLMELNSSVQDLFALIDNAIMRMHQEKLFVKEDTHTEKSGTENVLFTYAEAIVGSRPTVEPRNIEDF